MTLPSGLRIYPGKRIDHLDGAWWLYACEYILPGQTEQHEGYIQGDGELFEPDTLEDEDGNPVKIT